jgi:hypothetical protein
MFQIKRTIRYNISTLKQTEVRIVREQKIKDLYQEVGARIAQSV